jgi:large subunit ribosomal protein L19
MITKNDEKENLSSKNSNSLDLIKLVESKFLQPKSELKELEIGDLIKIGYTIIEGEKERTQFYEGILIAKNNRGIGQTFTIRRKVQGIGVEQVFLLNSPKIVSVVKIKSAKVRRAKLYYLRGLSGKSARLQVKI